MYAVKKYLRGRFIGATFYITSPDALAFHSVSKSNEEFITFEVVGISYDSIGQIFESLIYTTRKV